MALTADYLVTDDLTILLGLIAVTVFLLHNLYKPQSLVHPILLGRQSDVGNVRNPGESALYRNYGTGLFGRLSVKPEKDINILSDMVRPDFDTPRTLWSTKISNPRLKERISAFGSGLVRFTGLVPHEDNVLLLLNDGLEFLISDFALASLSIPSFTISSPSLLSPVLDSHPPSAIITHGHFLPHILELIYDSNESEHHTVIVVGDFDPNLVGKAGNVIKVVRWTDVESAGANGEPITSVAPNPDDVFTVSFFASETGQLQGVHLTHTNFTAGVAAIRALLPHSYSISSLDTMISAHSLSTSFGRAIAYAAVFEGSNFATLDSTMLYHMEKVTPENDVNDILSATKFPIPSPTILFIKPAHLQSLSSSIATEAEKSSWLYSFASRHKLSGVIDGFITKDSLWDRMVFDGARSAVLGDGANTVRGVIVSGGPLESSYLTPARITLSILLVNSHIHPAAAGPLFASHPADLQIFPAASQNTTDPFAHTAHVGPPSSNIEAKLVGVDDQAMENGADPIGVLMVRGPTIGKVLGVGEDSYVEVPSSSDEGWVGTSEKAKVLANGAFIIEP